MIFAGAQPAIRRLANGAFKVCGDTFPIRGRTRALAIPPHRMSDADASRVFPQFEINGTSI
jgi:hypothetical protein